MSTVMKINEVSESTTVADQLSDLPTANFSVPLSELKEIYKFFDEVEACPTASTASFGKTFKNEDNGVESIWGHVYLGGGTLVSEVDHRFIRKPEDHEINKVATLDEGLATYLDNQG